MQNNGGWIQGHWRAGHSALHHASRLSPTYHEMMTFPDYARFSEYERLVPRMKKEFGVKVFYLDTEKDELIEV